MRPAAPGACVARTPWSQVVDSYDHAVQALAAADGDPAGPLDLRVLLPDGTEPWDQLGFAALAEHQRELVRPLEVLLPGVEATRALGARLAAALRAGDLVLLSGPLGAGKTALTQGLGAALGVEGPVTSPTFVLARRHEGPLPLVHVDAYRLRGEDDRPPTVEDLEDLGLDADDAVVVVEWGGGLPVETGSRLDVVLDRDAAGGGRRAEVRPHGPRWATHPA